MRDLFDQEFKPKFKRLLLGFDSWLDSSVFHALRWLREYYERFSAFMDRFHVAGWRRWTIVEPMSEGATVFGRVLKDVAGMRERVVITTKCGIRRKGVPHPDSPYRYDFSAEHT